MRNQKEFVPFDYSEVTLENIKRACKVHYRGNLTICDIFTSEQGPSRSWLDQIPNFKVSYARLIMTESGKSILSETLALDPFHSQPQYKKVRKNAISHSVVSPVSTAKSIASSVVPKSLSVEDMLKFGKIIKPVEKKNLYVGVEEFDLESKKWVVLGPVSLLTEIAPFGESGFRYTFKATSNRHKFRDATYVIKRYKTSALENIEISKQSPEIQSRKIMQMN